MRGAEGTGPTAPQRHPKVAWGRGGGVSLPQEWQRPAPGSSWLRWPGREREGPVQGSSSHCLEQGWDTGRVAGQATRCHGCLHLSSLGAVKQLPRSHTCTVLSFTLLLGLLPLLGVCSDAFETTALTCSVATPAALPGSCSCDTRPSGIPLSAALGGSAPRCNCLWPGLSSGLNKS